jgi:hypothetical protein
MLFLARTDAKVPDTPRNWDSLRLLGREKGVGA